VGVGLGVSSRAARSRSLPSRCRARPSLSSVATREREKKAPFGRFAKTASRASFIHSFVASRVSSDVPLAAQTAHGSFARSVPIVFARRLVRPAEPTLFFGRRRRLKIKTSQRRPSPSRFENVKPRSVTLLLLAEVRPSKNENQNRPSSCRARLLSRASPVAWSRSSSAARNTASAPPRAQIRRRLRLDPPTSSSSSS